MRSRSWAFMALAMMALAPGEGQSAGLLIADGGLGGVLEIQQHDVDVTVNNGIAVTHVTQVFHNTENRQVEALYTFPVPKNASISNFSMWINGKEIIGEVLEKQKAREIYNSYKQVRRDPGLLEQTDFKTFEMRIFPVAPNADQKVQISYYQELDSDHDWSTYAYPLAKVTRTDAISKTTGPFAFRLRTKSEVPIVSLDCPSHRNDMALTTHTANLLEASMETKGGDLSRDVVLAWQNNRPRTGVDLITSRKPGEDGFFALSLTAGDELKTISDQGADYVFVLDVSGSMQQDSKLTLSRDSILAFIKTLSVDDQFEIIAFNSVPVPLFRVLTTPTSESLALATQTLNNQSARGGTNLRPAVEAAYRFGNPDRPLNVVIMSDGMTDNGSVPELRSLIEAKPSQARVFCVGVGNEVNRTVLNQLANETGGLAAYVSREDNFARQAEAFSRKLKHPVMTNLKFEFFGVQVAAQTPDTIPNLFHGSPIRMYGRYAGSGKAQLKITGEVMGRQTAQELTLDFPESNDTNPEIERMWAWKKIDGLLTAKSDSVPLSQDVRDQIVQLGETYSIVTEYTSFLVLENDAEYQRWKIERRNASRMGRDRVSQERVRQQFIKMRDESLAQIGPLDSIADAAKEIAAMPNPATHQVIRMSPKTNNPAPRRSGLDFDIPSFGGQSGGGGGGGGGGAFDPLTAAAAALGVLFLARRSRRSA
jgi:Ca-activated chloride channel homolog